MKKILVLSIFIGNFALAADEAKPVAQPSEGTKITTKDAKKACKDEGKSGTDLLKCIKEKQGEK